MKKNILPFTQAGVLAYIQANRGIRYECNKLAKNFGCGSSAMRIYLQELALAGKITVKSNGRVRWYFIKSEAELRAEEEEARKLGMPQVVPFRPLQGYDRGLASTVALRMAGR